MGRSPRPGVWRAVIRAAPLLGGVVLGLLLMPLMPTGHHTPVEVVSLVQRPSAVSPRVAAHSRGVTLLLPPAAGRHPAALAPLLAALRQLRATSPATQVAVVVNEDSPALSPDATALADRVVALPAAALRAWGGPIAALLASPWQRTLFLGAGVQACHPLDEMFDWLDRYDVGVALNPLPLRQALLSREGSPGWTWAALNDYRPDVVLFDRNPRVVALLNAWNDRLLDPAQSSTAAFADALLRSDVRVKTLPAEFNLVLPPTSLPVYLTGAVRLLNTAGETCERVNHRPVPRLYDVWRGRAVYSWQPVPQALESTPLVALCEADEGRIQQNTKFHQPVVPDQLEVP
eukprot:EG_transcript_13967